MIKIRQDEIYKIRLIKRFAIPTVFKIPNRDEKMYGVFHSLKEGNLILRMKTGDFKQWRCYLDMQILKLIYINNDHFPEKTDNFIRML